jgi:hypothetical protein
VELRSQDLLRRFFVWKRSVFRKMTVATPALRGRGQALKKRWGGDEIRRHSCDISDIDPVDERCNSWGRFESQAGLDSRSMARVARRKQPGVE